MLDVEQAAPQLLQLRYTDDPWKLIVTCILLNRTRWTQVEPLLDGFFRKYRSASDLAIADYHELSHLLHPLGFQNQRAKLLVSFSNDYFCYEAGFGDRLEDCRGVGKYALDSFKMFCLGMIDIPVEDYRLREYRDWFLGIGSTA
jgi:methyl-CpG-binding domain protein 4